MNKPMLWGFADAPASHTVPPDRLDEAVACVMENGTPEAYAVAFAKLFLGKNPDMELVDKIGMALDRRDFAGAIRLGLKVERGAVHEAPAPPRRFFPGPLPSRVRPASAVLGHTQPLNCSLGR